LKVIGKCQLQEALEEKEKSFEALGKVSTFNIVAEFKIIFNNHEPDIQLWKTDQIGASGSGKCSA
jgi:frataxin-like iron-binding protein CyaY